MRQKELAALTLPDRPSWPVRRRKAKTGAEPQRRLSAGIERGVQMVRCERTREQPGTELPPRDAGELTTAGKRDGLRMRARFCIRPTFDMSGGQRAQPVGRPLDGRVRQGLLHASKVKRVRCVAASRTSIGPVVTAELKPQLRSNSKAAAQQMPHGSKPYTSRSRCENTVPSPLCFRTTYSVTRAMRSRFLSKTCLSEALRSPP